MLKDDSYSPDIEHALELEDLYKCGARCDAWRAFFQSRTLATLRKLKGHLIWFNRHEYFDRLICEFDCPEKKLRQTLEALVVSALTPKYIQRLRHPKGRPAITFLRDDLYDARAWCRIPLDHFIPIPSGGFTARTHDDSHSGYVLKHNEMPVLQFGLQLPWIVSRDCFTLTHRLKDGGRFAEMFFKHPQLNPRFQGRRWVADQNFPRNTTGQHMEETLIALVQANAPKYLFAIVAGSAARGRASRAAV